MKKILLLFGFLLAFAFGYSQTSVQRPRINASLLNGQLSTYYLDTSSLAQRKAGQLTIEQTPIADAYTQNLYSIWTAGADMAAGGSNGIYAIANPVEDVQNAYSLRGRMDLRDAVAAVEVNQLHAVDALVNLNTTYKYTVDDNISVFGGAIHGNAAGDIDGTGTGALGGATLNVLFGMWGPTATADLTVETNFIKMISHAGTTVDYGLNIETSSDMDAGILLNSHASNSPATMDVGLEMISAASAMLYGIDMSQAGITTADIRLQNSATLVNTDANTLTITEPTVAIIGEITALKTTEQLRLSYDASYYLTTTVLADGHTTFTTVDAVGAEADINFTPDGNVGIKTAAPGTALEVTGTTTTTAAIVSDLATANTEVVSPSATGLLTTLATDDIGDIAFTLSGGMTYVSTEGLMTIGTGGTFERLNEGAIAYTGSHLHDFTHSDGRLTYTGANTKHFTINISINIEGEESNQRVTLRLYKDGALITEIEDRHDFTAVDTDDSVGFTWLVEMATNEYVEVWGTSDVDADEFTVLGGSMVISQH